MEEYTKIIRIRYRERLFDIFTDQEHKKHFLEIKIKDGKEIYYYPLLNDDISLNIIYNATDNILYAQKYSFKKIATVSITSGIVLLIGINIPNISNFIKNNYQLQPEYQESESIELEPQDIYNSYSKVGNTIYIYHNNALTHFGFPMVSFEELKATLESNPKIIGKYKEYAVKFINALEERLPKTDLRIINENFKTIEFEVVPNEDWKKPEIDAYYDSELNKIFVKKSYSTVRDEKEVVFHELGHTLNNGIITCVDPATSIQYRFVKRFYTLNDYGNSFSEGLNTILTDYLLTNDWKNYFNQTTHYYDRYSKISNLEYQFLLLDTSYTLYDYLNGNVDKLEKHLQKLDLEEMIDTLDVSLKSNNNSISVVDSNNLKKLEEKIIEKRVLQQLDQGKSDLEIYQSLIGLSLTYSKKYDTCTNALNQANTNWTIRIQETTSKSSFPTVNIYYRGNVVCQTDLKNILIYKTYKDKNGDYHFGQFDYQNNVLYDIETNKIINMDNLKEVTKLTTILNTFSWYDIDINTTILDSKYFKALIKQNSSSNEEEIEESNHIIK